MNRRKLIAAALALALALALPIGGALAANGAPVAENLNLTTYRNVCVGGQLAAVDPEGDTMTFEITTQPTKGSVEVTDDGRFVYTPDTNRKGRDYFGYRAVDETGARSQEATVIINIEKQKTQTTYSDMAGHPGAYAATALAENDIFTGEKLGGVWMFQPEREVTRAEFLSMCMELTGEQLLSGVSATGFADDADISDWLKPYVATALMDGIVSGYGVTGGAVFEPDASITTQEAAVMLDNVLDTTDVAATALTGSVADWAAQATSNLAACGVITEGTAFSEALTRAGAAEMLVRAMEVLSARED